MGTSVHAATNGATDTDDVPTAGAADVGAEVERSLLGLMPLLSQSL